MFSVWYGLWFGIWLSAFDCYSRNLRRLLFLLIFVSLAWNLLFGGLVVGSLDLKFADLAVVVWGLL